MAKTRRTSAIDALLDEVRWYASQVEGQARRDAAPFDEIGVSLAALAADLRAEADRVEVERGATLSVRGQRKWASGAASDVAQGALPWQASVRAWVALVRRGAGPRQRVSLGELSAELKLGKVWPGRAEQVLRMALPRLVACIAEDGRFGGAELIADGEALLATLVASQAEEVELRRESRASLGSVEARKLLLDRLREVDRIWRLVLAPGAPTVTPLRARREVVRGARGTQGAPEGGQAPVRRDQGEVSTGQRGVEEHQNGVSGDQDVGDGRQGPVRGDQGSVQVDQDLVACGEGALIEVGSGLRDADGG